MRGKTGWKSLRRAVCMGLGLMVLVLSLTFSPMLLEQEAAQAAAVKLRVPTSNLTVLQKSASWAYYASGQYYLKYYSAGQEINNLKQYYDAYGYKGIEKYGSNYCRVQAQYPYAGTYYYQCVDWVKFICKNGRSDWRRGNNALSGGLTPGQAIATFNSSGYYNNGHCAIFLGYVRNSSGAITGIWVADQNWGTPSIVKKHVIPVSGSGVNRAGNYYEVVLP